ncbi:MAG: methyltransferase domain-containing protein [Candidatus Omnitrophica bacterium]|nr:methyltransferase domain-containing protein [Candidatus Omnitrophota bacterium]MCB9747912.1 methyltransferase domain-containing protein [Candidatus Omnitrophota bacterium]
MGLFKKAAAFLRKFNYKYLAKWTGKHSGIISMTGNDIEFYRGHKVIKVKKTEDRLHYENYADWKMVQERKGKKGDLSNIWNITREKQLNNWNFGGLKQTDKLLEVGFRDGHNLEYLKNQGIDVEGIEVNGYAVEYAKSLGCKAFEEDIQQRTHFADKTFDLISACDVLEHCFSPENALQEMKRILKDDGRMVVEIPLENEFKENLIHGHSALYHDGKTFERLVESINLIVVKSDLSNKARSLFVLKKKK